MRFYMRMGLIDFLENSSHSVMELIENMARIG